MSSASNHSHDEEGKDPSPEKVRVDPTSVSKTQPTTAHKVKHEDLFAVEDESTITFKITHYMAYHPIIFSSLMFLFILVVVIASVVLGVAEISDSSEYDWVIASTDESRNLDAFDDAISRLDPVSDSITERSVIHENKFYFIYESKDGSDIYTAENLLRMCRVESLMVHGTGFSDVCHLTDGNCTMPENSIVAYFYGFESIKDWNCVLLSDSDVSDKKDPIYDALATPAGQEQYGIWLSANSVDLGYSTLCNSIWVFGTPLAGYESESDREDAQFEVYQKFLASLDGSVKGVEADLFDYFGISDNSDGFFKYYPTPYMSNANTGNLRVYWFSPWNLQNEFIRMLDSDLFFAVFSILFVVTWLRVHTGSTLLALSGIYMIVTSLPFTILIYKKVFNIPFYSELHSLVLFVVLGVGADDVFVLTDSWNLTKYIYPGDVTNGRNRPIIHRRLLKCYRHTMSTVFNTSFTTSMAFIATGMSPLMPIATFGWFAATCIVCNYLFVISLMPPIAIIAEIYFGNSCVPCQEKTESANEQNEAKPDKDNKTQEDYKGVPSSETGNGLELTTQAVAEGAVVLGAPEDTASNGDKNSIDKENELDCRSCEDPAEFSHTGLGTKLLHGYMNTLEMSVKCYGFEIRYIAIALCISLFAFGIVGIIYGSQLEPPTSQESWFPSGHMMQDAQAKMTSDFIGVDEAAYATISVTLGISGIDRSGFNEYIPAENRGTAKFDNSFDLAAPACQKVFVRMCEDIPEFACGASPCKPTNLLARANTTRCFMTDFRSWALDNYGVDSYDMNKTYFYDRLHEFRKDSEYQNEIGFIDDDLKFATVEFTSTMENEEPMNGKQDVLDYILAFLGQVRGYSECDSCSCDSLMYTSPYAFVWMRSEMGLVRGFYQGMFIAFPVAFCVLMFATGNIFISFYAILSVLFIVFGVLGFANYGLHWDLGVAESIAGIIIIGFSVDYTVHLGHMYTDGEEQLGVTDRVSKFEHASREIVPTVVGGAITTAGAGCFMFFCQLQFFVKMAALIVSTILLSYVYSLGFFMSVLLVIGPEKDQGKVKVITDWLFKKLNIGDSDTSKVNAEKVKNQDEAA